MKFVQLLYCLFTLHLTGYSQYQIQHYTTENGLPSNGIKGMEWDEKTGFLWIATEAGLVRYDGMGFRTFDVLSNPELGSNRIVELTKNSDGKILMAGEEGNLTLIKNNGASLYFDGKKLAKYNFSYYGAFSASDRLFRQCFKDPWTTIGYGVRETKMMPLSDTSCIIFSQSQLYYYSVAITQPAILKTVPVKIKTAFSTNGQLYYLDSLNHFFTFHYGIAQYTQQELLDTAGGKFPINQKNGKLLWQPGMEAAVWLQQGKVWLIEKANNNQLRFRLIASGIPENVLFIYAQYKKEGGYLFLGSASKGVYIIHKKQLIVKQATVAGIEQINSVYSQIELPDGNILTGDGTIIGDAPNKNDFNIGKAFENSVYLLNDSMLIYTHGDKGYSYNNVTHNRRLLFVTHTNLRFGLTYSQGSLYFANQKGIGIINAKGSINFLKYFSEKAQAINVASMIETAPGKLALATCDGLLGFDIETKKLDTILTMPAVCIRALLRDGEYTFIGTYGGGFYVMKNGIVKSMPLDINQYLKYTHCFIKDKNDFCWISTNNGLFKVQTDDIKAAYDNDLPQIYYHYLGKDEGMETTEINGGCMPCAIRLKSGNFSFPTMDGLIWFNPEKTAIALPSGDIYIDKITADGKNASLPGNDFIRFADNVKKIDISLAINAWCKKENLYIDYKLNSANWIRTDMTTEGPLVGLSDLSYGKNILQIRKMNGFGTNKYSYVTIDFWVAKPYYYQWWFILFIVAMFFCIAYFILRLRLYQYDIKEKKLSAMVDDKTMDLNLKNIQLEKNDQIKTRLISVINHDIITPLKFMHYAARALVENKETISKQKQFDTIVEIKKTAKDMEILSSQILNWIIYQNPNERMQKEKFNLYQLVEMVCSVLQFAATPKNTVFLNRVPADAVVYQYLEPLRVLIYNLILNSINFTKDGTITVSAIFHNDSMVISIADTGFGMTKEQIDNLMSDEKIIAFANVDNKKGTGLGYMIIKDLLKIMGGALFVKSIKNNGTKVSVSLPIQ